MTMNSNENSGEMIAADDSNLNLDATPANSEVLATPELPNDEILSLEDKFVENEIDPSIQKMAELQAASAVEVKAGAAAMPNVLVDEELMAEIAKIPDRFGFKIGDVADLLGIKQYVLRYWEQEFDLLKPKKASNNQRLYTKKDVENAFLIRKLLYRDKFSIEGARQALKDVKFAFKKEKDFNSVIQKVDQVQVQMRAFAEEIRRVKNLFA